MIFAATEKGKTMRLIDADEAREMIDEWLDTVGDVVIGKGLSYYGELLGCLRDCKTIDAVPVVHGRWIYVDGKGIHAEYECDNCREHVCFDEKIEGTIPAYERCPHCGAYMRGTDNG